MHVVITGASRGLGLELTRQHLARGDSVFATCRGAPPPALTALGPSRLTVASLDVTRSDSIARAAEACPGPVDLLWSNAGVYPGSPGTEVQEGRLGTLRAADGLSVLATNAVGALLVAQAFLPRLKQGTRPRLVGLSSGYGSLRLNRGTPYWYGASKAALNMLYRSLAFDAAARGVTVVVLSPGWSRTDMGGPGATTPVAVTVQGMLAVADGLGPEQSGSFLDWQGQAVPW
jgi:NAD(P)-dependent dehydrogenase (short-subunit alcohol dehydrogenase family)